MLSEFWAGEFGDEYSDRNKGDDLVAANLALFSRALRRAEDIRSIVEFGANRGLNLKALRSIYPAARMTAVEINGTAATILRNQMIADVHQKSMLGYRGREHDLAFTKGVLIHIAPEDLEQAYTALYRSARRYILVAEYYNPTPVEVPYRGHAGKLFKRDFAGELLDRYDDLKLLDFGFSYHRHELGQDDLNWFLMEKRI